jgi:uncharacterized surface protein with fasciclin (FAS1) repeats
MESRSRSSLVRTLLRLSPRGLYLQGLTLCGLLDDIDELPQATLLAPQDAAFDALPMSYRELLVADHHTHALFDLLEASVLPGRVVPSAVPHATATLGGSWVSFVSGGVHGACDFSRIVSTIEAGPVVIHVVDRCVMPPSWMGVVGSDTNGRALVA